MINFGSNIHRLKIHQRARTHVIKILAASTFSSTMEPVACYTHPALKNVLQVSMDQLIKNMVINFLLPRK